MKEFIARKGLKAYSQGQGSIVLDIQGENGQLFSITDDLSGDLFGVSDISGIPILNVNADGTVSVDGTLDVVGDSTFTGNLVLTGSATAGSFVKDSATADDILLGDGTTASLSGINAATLDSIDSTQFLRSDEGDTFGTGSHTLTINGYLKFQDVKNLVFGTDWDVEQWWNGAGLFTDFQTADSTWVLRNVANEVVCTIDIGNESITTGSFIKESATADDILLGDGTTTSLATIQGAYVAKAGDTMTGALDIDMAAGSNPFSVTSGTVLRSVINDQGMQTWYLNNGSGEVGRLAYSTPGGRPGIVFFDSAGASRSQMVLTAGGGIEFGSNSGGGVPTNNIKLSNAGDVEAASFTKTGGVSTEFLKADGSVDTTSYAPLNGSSKIDESYLPASIVGQVSYVDNWNANTNTPTLPDATTVNGNYYIVDTAGTYNTVDYNVGDWIISNGVEWKKIDNTDSVTSVFGRSGIVTAQSGDYDGFYPLLTGTYNNPSWINQLAWNKIQSTPTTLAGYGITDAYTKTNVDNNFVSLDGDNMTGALTVTGHSIGSINTGNPGVIYANRTDGASAELIGGASASIFGFSGGNFGIAERTSGNVGGTFTGTYRLIVEESTGNVGINITDPTEKLDVDGNIQISSTNELKWTGGTGTSIKGWSGRITVNHGGSESIRVNNGKLKVGTSASGADALTTLDVRGDTRVEGNLNVLSSNDTGLTTNSTLTSFAFAGYDSAVIEYVVKEEGATAMRSGTIQAVWDGTSVSYNHTLTTNIGASTDGIDFDVVINGVNIDVNATITSGTWTVKTGIRLL